MVKSLAQSPSLTLEQDLEFKADYFATFPIPCHCPASFRNYM